MSTSEMSTAPVSLEELLETFEFLDQWDERYKFLIETGQELPSMPAEDMTEENKVHGCMSQVWMTAEMQSTDPPTLDVAADSDSVIVKGLIAVLLALYSGRTPEEILARDPEEVFNKMGLGEHLSSQRRNGLYAMVKRVKALAAEQVPNT